MEFISRFLQKPTTSYFLFGPRGTGKSTFLKHACPSALYIDLLSPDIFRRYSARPERLHEIVTGHSEQGTVIIDEIQKIPELLNVVHTTVAAISHNTTQTLNTTQPVHISHIHILWVQWVRHATVHTSHC